MAEVDFAEVAEKRRVGLLGWDGALAMNRRRGSSRSSRVCVSPGEQPGLQKNAQPIERIRKGIVVHALCTLELSGFSSVVLPNFGSTTDKFRQLYPLRLAPRH
jgi:hypothetical protein